MSKIYSKVLKQSQNIKQKILSRDLKPSKMVNKKIIKKKYKNVINGHWLQENQAKLVSVSPESQESQ